ncbi:hypothetical protein ALP83_200075 [Pseudomonas syringae pv. actinidiae]|uniref:Uncharacterized protein n=1 Tax=Pseudomonas syringae pv. actinidiae TaxID=103796 RepID=A0A7Z6UKK8_PSESF|nr:hypothetical protein ALP83_200075 [Pseudomonas syringae pv. actinidiae]
MGQYADRGFARAVVVDHPAIGFELTHLLDQRRRTGFAADDQCMLRQHIGRMAGL